jgi:DNA polymerase-4
VDEPEKLQEEAVRMADAVATRLRAAALAARTVTIKVRFADFVTITRSATGPRPLDTGPEIARLAGELLAEVDVARGVRLFGVSVGNLTADRARQLSLDEVGQVAGPGSWSDATGAVDAVRARFGDTALGPATLAGGFERRPVRSAAKPGAVPSDENDGETAADETADEAREADAPRNQRPTLRIKRRGDTQWGPSG